LDKSKSNNHLARKLMLAVILSSSLITILTTAFQLYGLYSRDISAIDTRLKEIETIHIDSLAQDLWTADYGELNVRVDSMINIPDMLYVAVSEQGQTMIESGKFNTEQVVQRQFDLTYYYREEDRTIGKLLVQFDLKSVYDRLWNQLIDILISNSIKTFFISFVILWIFSLLVTRHIRELAEHLTQLSADNLDNDFIFSHKPVSHGKSDELDVLSAAFNEMKKNMKQNLQEIELSHQKIRQSEKFYESILDMNTAIIYVRDKQGQFIFINRQCENSFRLNKNDLKNKTVHDLFNTEVSGEQIKNDNAVLKARVPIEFIETMNYGNVNHTFLSLKFPLFDENNEAYAMGCVSTDITKLTEAQEKLQRKSLELEEILNNLIDGVVTVGEDFIFSDVNQAAENILGYRKKELVGQSVSLLMQEEDKIKFQMIQSTLVKIVSERMIGTSREFYARRKNGEVFPLQMSINSLPADEDDKKRFIVSFIDLTEIKEKEHLLRQSMKLEALGKLTGGIAHDYNNMLGVVQGYSELIEMSNMGNESLSEYVEQILRACKRGANLTKKLLTFSSYQDKDASVVNFVTLLNDMSDMIQKTLTIRIRLILSVDKNAWNIFVDQGALEDSILNMCINAMHAMPEGGDLKIDVANIELATVEARLFSIEAGKYVRMSIIDNGCGMSEEVQNRIFDPFFTTKGSDGTGLGLSQVYGFMKKSGGTIQVKSTPGVGTRFVLYFPQHSQAEDYMLSTDTKDISNDVYGNEKILIVEDEDALRMLSVELFSSHGYQVYSAANGIEAIPLLEKYNFSLVVSDLIMPEMDGYKLADYIRQHYPKTKIQLLSGYHDESLNSQIDEDLKNALLRKPVTSQSLLQRVRLLLDS